MKLTGNTQVEIDNQLNFSNLEYELNLNHNDVGVTTKKKNNNIENGIGLESSFGPINVKLNILTDKNSIPNKIEDVNLYLSADYKVNDNLKVGVKYETDCEQNKFEILSGTLDSNIKHNNVDLNLLTENIIYGYRKKDDMKINLFGNKINPSIGLIDNQINIGCVYNQIEEIDDYGNKKDKTSNKLCLDLDINI